MDTAIKSVGHRLHKETLDLTWPYQKNTLKSLGQRAQLWRHTDWVSVQKSFLGEIMEERDNVQVETWQIFVYNAWMNKTKRDKKRTS